MQRRILFVGENKALCEEFAAQFQSPANAWMAEYSRTGAEALARIIGSKFDAVFANVQLPDRSGIEVLDEILRHQPKLLRIIQSNAADQENTLKCVGRAHHHVIGPCSGATLAKLLHQSVSMESWLPSDAVQSLISEMRHLPSPPSLYFQIASEIQSPNASVENVAALISQDPAVTAKVLQLANSAMFGFQMQVASAADAVGYIGLETTLALVLLAHTFSSFDRGQLGGFSMDSLWHHSVRTGRYARQIALTEQSDEETVSQAFTAGLLHDIGKLLFAANLPQPFVAALELAREQNRGLWEVEAQLFGANHAELGGCVLGIWGLPPPIVDAVACHHFPLRLLTQSFSPLTATFAANIFEHALREDDPGTKDLELDPEYLKRLGLGQRVEEWQRSCQEVL